MADEIKVRIVGDVSNLKQSTEEASDSVDKLGSSMSNGVAGAERLEKGLAHLSTHIAAEAIPGMGRLARLIPSIGEAAVGVTPFLLTMIPIAALVAGVEIMNKIEEAAAKDAKEFAAEAVETSKLNDRIQEQNEKLTALVQGPMAAAVLKAKDFGDRTSELSSILDKSNAMLEAHTSKWAAYVQFVQRGTQNLLAYQTGAVGYASGVALSNAELEKQLSNITELYTKNGQYTQSLTALQKVMEQLRAVGGPESDQQMEVVEKLILNVGKAQQAALKEQQVHEQEATTAQAKASIDRTTILAGEVTRFKNLYDIKIADAEAANKQLESVGKAQIATASEDKTVAGAETATAMKLSLNQQEAEDAHRLMQLKIDAAQKEAEEEIKIAEQTKQQKIAALAGDNAEARAQKTAQLEAETADKVKNINSDLAKNLDKLRNDDASQQASFEEKKTEITVAGVKARQEAQAHEFEESEKLYDAAFKSQEAQIQRTLKLQESAAQISNKGSLFQSTSRADEPYLQAEAALQKLMDQQRQHLVLLQQEHDAALASGNVGLANSSQDQIEATQNSLQVMGDDYQGYQDRVKEINQQIGQSNAQMLDRMTAAFNQNTLSWMQGHEKFGQAMMKTWQSVASGAVSSLMKIGEAEIQGLLVHDMAAKQRGLVDAKSAAKGAYTAVVGIPYVGPILAPIAAATAFAAVAAFEKGGIVENDTAALVHKNEMVLPERLSKFVQGAAAQAQDTGSAGGGDNHFHYAPVINAIDRNGMEDALKDHGDAIFSLFQTQMRNRNQQVG